MLGVRGQPKKFHQELHQSAQLPRFASPTRLARRSLAVHMWQGRFPHERHIRGPSCSKVCRALSKGDSAGIWLPEGVLGRRGRFTGVGSLCDQAGDRVGEPW